MLRVFVSAFALLASSALSAAELPSAFLRFAEGLQSLQGTFTQQTYGPNGDAQEASSGLVALSKPNRFRWDYEAPFAQSIIADGQRIWVYDPDLDQVTVKPQAGAEQDSPLSALLEPEAMRRQFSVESLGEREGLQWLRLTPLNAEQASVTEAELVFDGDSLRAMRLVDSLQQRSELRFAEWQRNAPIPDGTFQFVPPEGVDVVGEVDLPVEVFTIPED